MAESKWIFLGLFHPSQALQTLWDEQFLGKSHHSQHASFGANYIQEELTAAENEWPEQVSLHIDILHSICPTALF